MWRNDLRIPVYCISDRQNYTPLSLGMVVAWAKVYQGGILEDAFNFVPGLIKTEEEMRIAYNEYGAGVFLFSNYLWTIQQNLHLSRLAKQLNSNSLIVHGGPSAPAYPDACQAFFEKHSYVDVVVRGEGEMTAADLLDRLNSHREEPQLGYLANVSGLTFRLLPGKNEVMRTMDRERIQDLNQLPSPFQTGLFEKEDAANWTAAIVETNRGCPYSCTFCDWGSSTMSQIRQFSQERVGADLEWIAAHKISVIWLADSNFGIVNRDVEIAEFIAKLKERYGYPKQVVVNYAKNATDRLAEIIRIFNSADVTAQGIISIQTQDPQTLRNIRRSNISTQKYEELISTFREQKLPISSDIMIGLPGTTVRSFKDDLQFFFDRQVKVVAYVTMVLPNSPMAAPEYMRQHSIKVDGAGYIISTSSFTPFDRWTMQMIYRLYEGLVGYGILKYFLYYLQIDHRIQAIDYIHDYYDSFHKDPSGLPETGAIFTPFFSENQREPFSRVSDVRWAAFYKEIAAYTRRRYGIAQDSGMSMVLEAQQRLIPRPGRSFPETFRLAHDLVAYMDQVRQVRSLPEHLARNPKPLIEYSPGELVITDPLGLCGYLQEERESMDTHRIQWELTSDLMMDRAGSYLAPSPKPENRFGARLGHRREPGESYAPRL